MTAEGKNTSERSALSWFRKFGRSGSEIDEHGRVGRRRYHSAQVAARRTLREVVLFPMNQRAEDLMMGAPSEVSAKQSRELHIRVVKPD